jgi:hypothetical protein
MNGGAAFSFGKSAFEEAEKRAKTAKLANLARGLHVLNLENRRNFTPRNQTTAPLTIFIWEKLFQNLQYCEF